MPVITAHILKGRSVEIKRRLAAALTTAMADAIDVQPQSIHVLIEEYERENWATGGELFADKSSTPKADDPLVDIDALFKKPTAVKEKPTTRPAKARSGKAPARSRSRR